MKNFILFILLFAAFTSCQKDYEVPDLVLNGPTGGLPVSYKLVSADEPKKAFLTKFVYDADKRVSKVYSIELDSSTAQVKRDTFMVETFVYAGANAVPSKLVTNYYTNYDTTYYQFDNAGRLTKDSTVSLGMTIGVRRIAYTTTGFTVVVKETGSPDIADSMVVMSDNLTYLRRGIVGFPQYTQEVQLTYDTQDNPMYEQNIRPVRFHMDLTDIGWTFYSSKKALKSFSQSGIQSGSASVANTVNSGGKLTKQTMTQNGQFVAEITYEY